MVSPVQSIPKRRQNWSIGLIAGGSIIIGLLVAWVLSVGLGVTWIFLAVASITGLLIYLLTPHFVVRSLLFLAIATSSLGTYELYAGGMSLQLMRIVLLFAVAAWLPFGLRRKLRLSVPALLTFVLVIFAVLSTTLLSRNIENSISLTTAMVFGAIYLFWLPNVLQDKAAIRFVQYGIYAAGILLLAFGIYQYVAWFTGYGREGYQFVIPFADFLGMEATTVLPSRIGSLFRVTLPHSSASFVGPNIAAILLVVIALRMTGRSGRSHAWLDLVLIPALFVLLILTYSRAAWLGFVAGLLVITLYLKSSISPRHILAGFFITIIVATGALLVAPEIFSSVAQRFDPEATAGSDELHAQFVADASQLWVERPVFGFGVGNYPVLTGILHAHNAYATQLVEGGLTFLLLNLAWIASVIVLAHRTIDRSRFRLREVHGLAVGLLAAFVSFLVDNLFQMTWYLGVFWTIVGLITALAYHSTPSDGLARKTDEV